MKTFAYIRVSTGRQELSPDAQEKAILDYCALYDMADPVIVRDIGQSGGSMKREGLQMILDAVNGYDAKAVVCYKLDRLFRNAKDAFEIFALFEAKGVALHSVQERLDTSTAMGRLTQGMIILISQLESEVAGERTSFSLKSKKEKAGRNINGQAPYGFRWLRGELVRDVQEGPVLDFILKMDGESHVSICEALEAGMKPSRTGKPWSPRVVARIIHRARIEAIK